MKSRVFNTRHSFPSNEAETQYALPPASKYHPIC
jgi:hypothetical protein